MDLIRASVDPLNPLIQLKLHLIRTLVGLEGALNKPALDLVGFVGFERSACFFRFQAT